MTFILILVIQVQNLTFHWRHRTDVSGCKIGEGRSSLNLSKCQNLYQKMKLRVNQPAPAIKYWKSQDLNTILQTRLKSFSRWQYKFSKLWVVTKSLGFKAQARMLWLGKQRGEKWGVTGLRVTGNISGWLLNWKQDTFLDTVFIMDEEQALTCKSTQS